LEEEFKVYGLNSFWLKFVGTVKLAFATGMLAAIFVPTVLYNNALFPCYPGSDILELQSVAKATTPVNFLSQL